METLSYNNDIHICTCPNQHLLLTGDSCELCMGMVTDSNSMADLDSVGGDPFDELYFEALESFYEDITYAA